MISLYDILEASGGQLFGEPAAQIFTDFSFSLDETGSNLLFVTLKTDRGDTHRDIEQAIERGASGVICTRPPDCDTQGITVVLVRDCVDALMAWSHLILTKRELPVIVVAGSSGKAGTVAAIARVLSQRFKVHCSDPTAQDNRLSLPVTLSSLKSEHEILVLRLATKQPGELPALMQVVQPSVRVLTSIHHTDLDQFETVDRLAEEYRAVTQVEAGAANPLLIVNNDDDKIRAVAAGSRAQKLKVGVDNFGADIMAYNVVTSPAGTGFDLRYRSERHIARWIPLLGMHQLYGVLMALATGLHFGISLNESLRVLTELEKLPGRMYMLTGINDAIVIDDTNSANPQSTIAALDWLKTVKEDHQRVVVVLGDLDNLGTYSQNGHRLVGQHAASIADLLITVGAEATSAGRAAIDDGMAANNIHTTYSIQDTIGALNNLYELSADDIVLIKGGRSMQMSRVVNNLLKNPDDIALLAQQNEGRDELFRPLYPSWLKIDTDALAQNVRGIKRITGPDVDLMAVVKADGYGHGATATSRTALLNGAKYLAVANVQEALTLRDAGINAPILILSYTPIYAIRQAVRQNLTVSLYDLELARDYERAAREIGGTLKVHVKVESGLGRLGVMPDDMVSLFRYVTALKSIEIEGIYTHFSSADDNPEHTQHQLKVFRDVLRPLRAAGFSFQYIHAASSAALLTTPDSFFNMVRCGIALYGLHPSDEAQLPGEFKPVMSWKTVVAQVKTLPPNHPVGYGNTYHTSGEETIAIIPVGYADGFRRTPNWGEVLIHGQRAPVIGRVSMEKIIVSVANIPDVSIGDEVVLLGSQGDETITAEEIASKLGTINYEVVCNILARVARH